MTTLKFFWLGLISIPLAALTATPAVAQSRDRSDVQLGSRLPVRPEKADPVRDGIIRDSFVRCTYGPYRDEIDRFLSASDPLFTDVANSDLDTRKMFRRDQIRNCFVVEGDVVDAEIRFDGPAFRYMMLEAAYLATVRSLPSDHAGRAAPPRVYYSVGTHLNVARSLGVFSDCIAAADPVGADRLLRTGSGTDAEEAAALALVPALGSCIVQGQELTLTPQTIRSFAADGMWQRFVAPPQSQVAE